MLIVNLPSELSRSFVLRIISYNTVVIPYTRSSIWRAWPVVRFSTWVLLWCRGLSSALYQFRKDGGENEIEYEY